MSGRTFAIGDIHGCDAALDALLWKIEPSANDRLITMGDYIDRGPNSKAVIDRLLRLQNECELVPLIGNHEIMLLTARELPDQLAHWLTVGGRETLESYGLDIEEYDFEQDVFEAIPEDHLQFIDRCLPHYETDKHFFVHANYVPKLPLKSQPEFTLFWEHLSLHIPPPHISGKRAIVGHTPQTSGEILDLGHVVCIDTYCFGGGWLSALDIDNWEVWQTNQRGESRISRLRAALRDDPKKSS